jgi:hypothetical protein
MWYLGLGLHFLLIDSWYYSLDSEIIIRTGKKYIDKTVQIDSHFEVENKRLYKPMSWTRIVKKNFLGLAVCALNILGFFQGIFIEKRIVWKQTQKNHVRFEIQNSRTEYWP